MKTAERKAAGPRKTRGLVYSAAFPHLAFFALYTIPLIALHIGLLKLPFFWDELGQFIPTALDLFRDGSIVAHSATPNIHPPGVELYLVLWYKLFGYSIAITRIAMLMVAGIGFLITFLLAMELYRGLPGTPAFVPPVLLAISPLFFMQSMMAQLDMPAMVMTMVAVLLFIKGHVKAAVATCLVLVLVKETGAVTAAALAGILVWRRQYRSASWFAAPFVALGCWLLILHQHTGYWTGDPGFAHYNIGYSLEPVHVAANILRRLYYLFVAEFRWIPTVLIVAARKRLWASRPAAWATIGAVFAANFIVVTVFGGAELERYLLPVLPLFYITAVFAFWHFRAPARYWITGVLAVGLIVSLVKNPPYPFPYENNHAMVDFVELQAAASGYIEDHLDGQRIATAWPYTAGLRSRDFGFVRRTQRVVETGDFHLSSVKALAPDRYDALVTYTRTWMPENFLTRSGGVQWFLKRFYDYQPAITQAQCAALGLTPAASWEQGGQEATIYVRMRDMNHMPAIENNASGDHAAIAAGN